MRDLLDGAILGRTGNLDLDRAVPEHRTSIVEREWSGKPDRSRRKAPEKYGSYGRLPDEWTKVRIEVRGSQGRLYVNDHPQPTLVVNGLMTGPDARGAVALWIDLGTSAHFRNLTVTPASNR